MMTRTTTKTVIFGRPFALSGLEVQPAGTYAVETDEELIPSLSFTAYRRIATWLRLPGRRYEGTEPSAGLSEVVAIDPAELEKALASDAAHGETAAEPEAEPHHPQER